MTLPKVQDLLFRHLESAREARERAPSLLEGVLHTNASSAGQCARAIAYRVTAAEPSEPLTGDSLFNFYLGDAAHDVVQQALVAAHPQAQVEVNGVYDDFITCRADAVYPAEDGLSVVNELKTVSDFAFEMATGAELKSNGRWRKKDRTAQGAKREHILQVGISARCLNAPYLAITYIRKTAAKDEPILHEWRYKTEDKSAEIEAEIQRHKSIVNLARQGFLADREYEGNVIIDPLKQAPYNKFPCGYCSYQTACVAAGAGVVSIPIKENKNV